MGDANRILVADDNESARYAKTRVLRNAGFEVLEAASGNDTLRLVHQYAPRLVILDVQMPDLDGWEVCRRIKTDPATASVLVLQVSATHVRDEDTVRALEGGADASLTEPLDGPVLIATVRALLRARQAEDALREVLAREQAARGAAEEANRSKDEFLATLSHELRSPLSAILHWITLLRSGRVTGDRLVQAYEAIERNTRLQVSLIEDLLDVSRIISGKMRLDIALVDLSSVINGALESVRPAAEAKAIRIETRFDPTLGPLSGDAARLQQVVWNLLSNAVKFTPKGGRVEVRTGVVGSKAQVEVADNGRGIEPAFLPHLFERFRQADSSTTRAEGGLGLGLAIVRQLIELHGGTVTAGSAGLGHGATFTLHLPLPAVRLQSARLPAEAATPETLAGMRIVVVDDEVDSRQATAAVLEEWGAQVTAVGSAREGLEAIDRSEPDVVISDIAMPVEDGYSFIRRVRARPSGQRDRLRALALTAYAGVEEPARLLAAGYDDHLAKPADVRDLITAVWRLAKPPVP
jgi:signal transduction histidine kinase